MNRQCEFNYAGVNLHVWLRLRPQKGRGFLWVLLVIAWLAALVALVTHVPDAQHPGRIVLWAVALLLLWGGVIVRFTLWRLWGEEHLVINQQSMSIQYRYGLFESPIRTIPLHRPVVYYELTRPQAEQAMGIFHIIHYDPKTLTPKEVYRSSIELKEQTLQSVVKEVSRLQLDSFCEKYGFTPISLN